MSLLTAGRAGPDRPPPTPDVRRQSCQTVFQTNTVARQRRRAITGEEPSFRKPQTGVHPATIGVGLAAALWFIAVTWVSFARGTEVDWDLVVVTLFFIFFFGLFLFTATYALKDARWRQRDTSFREFLKSEVGTATGPMRGRDVLLEIAVIPVSSLSPQP
jgi:hypothetical protein